MEEIEIENQEYIDEEASNYKFPEQIDVLIAQQEQVDAMEEAREQQPEPKPKQKMVICEA